jgi:hypothetical protein
MLGAGPAPELAPPAAAPGPMLSCAVWAVAWWGGGLVAMKIHEVKMK